MTIYQLCRRLGIRKNGRILVCFVVKWQKTDLIIDKESPWHCYYMHKTSIYPPLFKACCIILRLLQKKTTFRRNVFFTGDYEFGILSIDDESFYTMELDYILTTAVIGSTHFILYFFWDFLKNPLQYKDICDMLIKD